MSIPTSNIWDSGSLATGEDRRALFIHSVCPNHWTLSFTDDIDFFGLNNCVSRLNIKVRSMCGRDEISSAV